MTDPTPSEQQAATTSLGDLLGEVTRDLSTLMRQEIALAKAELSESARHASKGAGLLGAGGYAGLMAIYFVSMALWWGLGFLTGLVWSAIIVAVIWAIIAAILLRSGRKNMKNVEGAPLTVDTLKEIPDAIKRNEENR
ncbi:phage holin family protein [Microbacterium sp. cx-55]|uniref:phage holin family protein n=1 Tax=unclassified Microbacterium TaxID=2609290 RepID=UPI001CBF4634|nr:MULTISPECIES: phage holin family protein [unclassified Microbacterium]MBZ4486951.1 phage holin family protein [Microbacterium sp. cx-55]MCC4907982.1 phage holin family protein [Microbacterium sp. cx-59]UGB35870.1 phage holin family protein [Microbacterium sp. cx-55]